MGFGSRVRARPAGWASRDAHPASFGRRSSLRITSDDRTSSTSTSAPVVSIASSSSSQAAGGSVINVSSLVSQLVAATEAPQQADLLSDPGSDDANLGARHAQERAVHLSVIAHFAGDARAFDSQTASSTDQIGIHRQRGPGAVAGNYTVDVSNLRAHSSCSPTPLRATARRRSGPAICMLSLGDTSFTSRSPAERHPGGDRGGDQLRPPSNPGISATVLQGTDGGHLVLSSLLTGAANTISASRRPMAARSDGTGLWHRQYRAITPGSQSRRCQLQHLRASPTPVPAIRSPMRWRRHAEPARHDQRPTPVRPP